MSAPQVVVIGIGADGWDGLTAQARTLIGSADVILGAPRHLDLLPPLVAARLPLPSPLRDGLAAVAEGCAATGQRLVVLASGDPLLSGIGTTLIDLLGAERVAVHPAVSSVSLARARMGWSAEEVDVVTLVGRDPDAIRRLITPGRRLVVLSSDATTPAALARILVEEGAGHSTLTVLGDLGAESESRSTATAAAWGDQQAPQLNIVAIEIGVGHVRGPGLPDDAFEHDGQLTKRDLRLSALSRLAPTPGQLLWDVGAGAGSVGIEWLRTDSRCRAIAMEGNEERAARIRRNAARLGVPSLVVVVGRAPKALAGLERPDAVFVGGGATADGTLDACWEALRPGGRLVVHAVTLETERTVLDAHARWGGELTRISVEHAAPIGTFTGWTPARAVVQWATRKEHP